MNDVLPTRRKLPHGVPPWAGESAVFFLSVNCRKRGENQLCYPAIAGAIVESVAFRQELDDWWDHLLVLMPDHLHALLSFSHEKAMRQVVSKWKEYVAKHIGVVWQRDFFDHRLRADENYAEKAHYIRMNPVRGGLCREAAEWPYVWDDFHAVSGGGSGGPALPTMGGNDGAEGGGGSAQPTMGGNKGAEGAAAGPPGPPRLDITSEWPRLHSCL